MKLLFIEEDTRETVEEGFKLSVKELTHDELVKQLADEHYVPGLGPCRFAAIVIPPNEEFGAKLVGALNAHILPMLQMASVETDGRESRTGLTVKELREYLAKFPDDTDIDFSRGDDHDALYFDRIEGPMDNGENAFPLVRLHVHCP